MLGQEVMIVKSDVYNVGRHIIPIRGEILASAMYIVEVKGHAEITRRKIMLLK